jgi:transcriptional regulator with XRE-family HTH domain
MFHASPYYALPDTELLKRVSKFIKKTRLELNITQEDLAFKTGLERTSISYIENGKGTSLLSLIQIFRALGKLELFATIFDNAETTISPIMMAKLQKKQRKYASSKKAEKPKKKPEW